jgi:hypothetical protein
MARARNELVICSRNEGYDASLEPRKVYVALNDEAAASKKILRVIDESGEDYLYPEKLFRRLALEPAVRRAVLAAE